MKLRDADRAIVERAKITEYLLNPANPRNRGKAAFFASFGFDTAHWYLLAAALRGHAAENEVMGTQMTAYGLQVTVSGPLRTPDGRDPLVRSGWIVPPGEMPRLVTAFRERKPA